MAGGTTMARLAGPTMKTSRACPGTGGKVPNIDGINMLFGDGHVKWKKKSEFLHLSKMYLWSRYPGGAIAHGDSFYY